MTMAPPLATRLLGILALVALPLGGCGDDDRSDSERVAEACESACDAIVGECNLPAPRSGDCAFVCQVGGALAPACARAYEGYVDCIEERPLLACADESVTVTPGSAACVAPLGDYIACGAEALLATCIELPLQDAECQRADLGERAVACARQPAGCALHSGTIAEGGFGVFCCS